MSCRAHARRTVGHGHARRRGHLLCHHQRHPRDLLRPTPPSGCPLGLYRKPVDVRPLTHSSHRYTHRTRRCTPRDDHGVPRRPFSVLTAS
ncbi:hypothetical protein A7X85_23600 [Streptomyces sp. ST1015]|nr:hypothetical protein A7X85_23600 [Streptomyces sp. ST1015]